MSLPVTDFGTLFLESYTKSGLAWVQTIGCLFIIYGYFVSNKKFLWKVLLAHGISGLLGLIIENFFIAKQQSNKAENWAFLLLINEVNWIIHEASTVLYSSVKLSAIVTNNMHKKILNGILISSLVIFALLRLNIGYLRFRDNVTMNPSIATAHSYAFLIWGFADLIIFALLVQNTINLGSQAIDGLLGTLLKSSIPRITILVLNTFLIVILGQLPAPLSVGMNNLNSLAWSIKGTYPIILMFDMHTTKDMLLMTQTRLNSSMENTTNYKSQNKSTVNVFGRSDV
ncbi:hypothetical protein BC833DRAFT_610986 [Globomyces pollinis-pini]|nr:hypothetical protein BC833DRAFT_610986 [Globomyces pollinis-pini]